ncbi:MAG TPA: pseudouridine synthase [Elusimicrobia bacterium]|nr:MAG: pseudouridine synthase [Elusimicrobia bacterium GWD2_63_28]HCC48359.1 pseudouridine synthase [Elusimicrobiota bacterium]
MPTIIFNKPYGVLSQFTPEHGHPSLAGFNFPKGVYPAGRLDHDSEGLLLLTSEGGLQARIADPRHKMPKVYWAQVEREITEEALARLRGGVTLADGPALPCGARLLPDPALPPRDPPVRFRKTVPTSWAEIILKEGRNRQVRRMLAAVGFPVLRLLRRAIGPLTLEGVEPGQWRELKPAEITRLRGKS